MMVLWVESSGSREIVPYGALLSSSIVTTGVPIIWTSSVRRTFMEVTTLPTVHVRG
ncbi:MAG: hypothetical protein OH363_05500 [Candidatus Parvarchaeota archaeon]|nr:hypothetical protein [Candidatus Jingweiarchaeum tengchongense]